MRTSIRAARRREEAWAYVMLAPYLLTFLAFLVYPSIQGLYLSFTDAQLGGRDVQWIGFENYTWILTDPLFATVVLNTLIFVAESTPLLIAIPLLLAVLLNRGLPMQAFLRGAFFVPFTLSVSVISITWWWLYEPNFGLVNSYVRQLGLSPIAWLTTPGWAMLGVVIATVWWTAGYNLVLFLAGLQAIPVSVYEAARIDGAGPLGKFVNVTIPMLSPTLFYIVVTSIIFAFQ